MAGKLPPVFGCFAWIIKVLTVGFIMAMLFYAINHSCAWSVGF